MNKEEIANVMADKDFWTVFGDRLGWKLYAFTGRGTAAFLNSAGGYVDINATTKADIERSWSLDGTVMPDPLDDLKRLLAEPVYDTPTIRWAVDEMERLRGLNIRLAAKAAKYEGARGCEAVAALNAR